MDPARTSTRDLLASRGLARAGSRERRDGSAHAGPGERQTGGRPSSSAPAPGTDRRGGAAPPSEPVEGGYAAAHAARLLQRERALRARANAADPAPRLSRAAEVLREAKAMMRELSPSSASGGSGATSSRDVGEETTSRWKFLRASVDDDRAVALGAKFEGRKEVEKRRVEG